MPQCSGGRIDATTKETLWDRVLHGSVQRWANIHSERNGRPANGCKDCVGHRCTRRQGFGSRMIPVSTVVAGALVLLFLLLASLHIYWALGGRWGAKATIPEVDGIRRFAQAARPRSSSRCFWPRRQWSWPCDRTCCPGKGQLPWLLQLGVWTLCAVFTLRAVGNFSTVGFFKVARNTAFARLDTLSVSSRSALSSPWAASLSHSNHEPSRCGAMIRGDSVSASACHPPSGAEPPPMNANDQWEPALAMKAVDGSHVVRDCENGSF